MNNQPYIDDLKLIKEIMNRSSRFISLSGLSGVFAGIYALIGALLVYLTVYSNQNYLQYREAILSSENIIILLVIAVVTLSLSIGTGVFFSKIKAKKDNEKLWKMQTEAVDSAREMVEQAQKTSRKFEELKVKTFD